MFELQSVTVTVCYFTTNRACRALNLPPATDVCVVTTGTHLANVLFQGEFSAKQRCEAVWKEVHV